MIKLLTGDVLACLAKLPDESVQCVVTSPPYWGLRDYQTARWKGGDPGCDHVGTEPRCKSVGPGKQYSNEGSNRVFSGDCCCGARRIDHQLGLERTPEEYVANLVRVFAEVRRVLRPDGTLWMNLGDSYATQSPIRSRNCVGYGSRPKNHPLTPRPSQIGLKPKDLVGIPWRVAFALQADGWYLRSDIIWHKPNPMPESVRDRPTKAHEYVFLLTKRERYFWDQQAVREGFADERMGNPNGGGKYARDLYPNDPHAQSGLRTGIWTKGSERGGRNIRSVWTITPKPFKGAHFATFPPALVERCVKAGTSERGACPACGRPWERVTERKAVKPVDYHGKNGDMEPNHSARWMLANVRARRLNGEPHDNPFPPAVTLGFRAACTCPPAEPVPCVVLDPFAGSGTVGLVCKQLGRDFIGIDLNPAYTRMARKRIAAAQPAETAAA